MAIVSDHDLVEELVLRDAEIARLRGLLQEVLDGILEEHISTPRGPRKWVSVGAWLVDGEAVCEVPIKEIRRALKK